MNRIVECVPNFSEGRRTEVVEAIVASITEVPGVVLLDREMDLSHNRAVISFVGEPEWVVEAVLAGARTAMELIDLNRHTGEHPRIGATDVVPFIPIKNVTMEQCVLLARQAAERIADELQIPVYLYEKAATRPGRENLAEIRRGEFEGLKRAIEEDPDRRPDFGPARLHPTAGATVVGARPPLIAYNVSLGTPSVDVAKRIARAVRGRDGGLQFVKALGFELKGRGITQVSMNLTDYTRTPIHRAFEAVIREAERYGVAVLGSEIVGLVPQDALDACGDWYLRFENFSRDQVLENRLMAALPLSPSKPPEPGLSEAIEAFPRLVAEGTPAPGGGSVAALVGALGASLGQMMCNLTLGRKKFAGVEPKIHEHLANLQRLSGALLAAVAEDAESFQLVMTAYKLPKENGEETPAREAAIQDALKSAVEVPTRTAEHAFQVLLNLGPLAEIGNPNLLSDVAVGSQLALAAIKGAYYNIVTNLSSITDEEFNTQRHSQMIKLIDQAEELATQIEARLLDRVAS
ncbi:MAG: glutamate formimidoyltransferase [Acidobacteria bacterium]|nr:glutamate formimidoyltransferase [Acidobacteriota bacterium]